MSFPDQIRIGEFLYRMEQVKPLPRLAFVRWNFDWTADIPLYTVAGRKGVSRPTRNEIDTGKSSSIQHVEGLPDTLRMVDTPYTTGMEAKGWVAFTKAIWKMEAPEKTQAQIDQAYASTYQTDRAFNNKAEDAQDAITSSGSVVKIGNVATKGGRLCYPIETLVGNNRAPDPNVVNPWTFPWLFFRATISRRSGYLGGLRWEREDFIEPFWQLGGHDVWLPLLSPTGANWLEASRLRPLAPDEPIPAPYHR